MKINVFRKNWLPDGFCILSRETAGGHQTFSLAEDYAFPRPMVSNVPLCEVKEIAVRMGRLQRKARNAGIDLYGQRLYSAYSRELWSGYNQNRKHYRPFPMPPELRKQCAQDEFLRNEYYPQLIVPRVRHRRGEGTEG